MAEGYSENVTIDEGVVNGVRTLVHFEGDDITFQKSFDAEPYLKYAEEARIATDGMNWGEGRFIGKIPPLHWSPISAIRDSKERDKAILAYFRDKPKLVMFNRFLRDL